MQIRGFPWTMVQGSRRLDVELSDKAKRRWQALQVFQKTGDWRLVKETFGVSRATLYRWRKQYHPGDWTTLEERSRRPKRRRQPSWPLELVCRVQTLREQYPSWGKKKLLVLLRREGFQTSAATVGRIMKKLRQRGVLTPSPRRKVSVRKRYSPRPYAQRKPKSYQPIHSGDLVQIDTLDIRPLPGVQLKHFTATDTVSRWDVVEAHRRATSQSASHFLRTVIERMPFAVKAVQIDGGSEYKALFEKECQKLGLKLFVLPPRSPKLNGRVERAHRTHLEEFYEVTPDLPWQVDDLNKRLRKWEYVYNHIRPHQALHDLTPAEFLANAPP